MWCAIDGHRICPGDRSLLVAHQEEQISLEIVKDFDDTLPIEIESLDKVLWCKRCTFPCQIYDRHPANPVVVLGHEVETVVGLLEILTQIPLPIGTRHRANRISLADQDLLYHDSAPNLNQC